MKKSKARMSQRIREGRVVSVFTRLSRAVRPSGCRCRIIQTPDAGHYYMSEGRPDWSPVLVQRAVVEGWDRESPDHPSCSQNAHDETVLVRCAQ